MRVRYILALVGFVITWMQGIIPYIVYVLATVVPVITPTVIAQPVEAKIVPTETPAYVATVEHSTQSSSGFDSWFNASQWPSHMYETVKRIVRCESGFSTAAISPGGHVGLMQVDPRFHGYPPSDPVGQLNQGYEVYLKQGWNAWSCY